MSKKKKNKKPVFTKETITKIKNVEKRMRDKPPADVPEVNNVLAESFGALTSAMMDLSGAIMDLGDRMISLETRMESLEEEVGDLKEQVNKLDKKIQKSSNKVYTKLGRLHEKHTAPAIRRYIEKEISPILTSVPAYSLIPNIEIFPIREDEEYDFLEPLTEIDYVLLLKADKNFHLIFIEVKTSFSLPSLLDFIKDFQEPSKFKYRFLSSGSHHSSFQEVSFENLLEILIQEANEPKELAKAKDVYPLISKEYWQNYYLGKVTKKDKSKMKQALQKASFFDILKIYSIKQSNQEIEKVLEVRK